VVRADWTTSLKKPHVDGRNPRPGATVSVNIGSDLPPTDNHSTETPRVEGDSEASDLELLRKSAKGSGKAFHALVERHADRLFRLAVSLIGSATDAEDVLQETFAGAYQGLTGFEGRASVKTWLTRILVTQAAKWRRDRKRRAGVIDHGMLDEDEARLAPLAVVPGGVGLVESRIDVLAAVQRLSEEHRDVVVLREFEHLSYEEIAEVLGVPRGTVESRLHRARAELREILKAYLP
jgi:RNA polymerase sigma-70 factor (ECF subfamily)